MTLPSTAAGGLPEVDPPLPRLPNAPVFDTAPLLCFTGANINQDACKTSFNTYCAGAFFAILTQVSLLAVAVFHAEGDRRRDMELLGNKE